MKTFFKLVPSLILPMLLVFTFIFTYKGWEEKEIVIAKLEKASKNVDHSKFAELQKPFATPQEMTAACLSCHNQRAEEIMSTAHWNWSTPDTLSDGRVRHIGKKNVLNNFCVGINTNEMLCSGCHIGYGYSDKNFDFHNPNNIDCIICHDNSFARVAILVMDILIKISIFIILIILTVSYATITPVNIKNRKDKPEWPIQLT